MESQKIAPNRVVSLSYSLSLTNGQIADEATAEQPLVFIHGIGQTLPEFDARIEGLSVGEGFSFTLTAEQGYGESDERWIIELQKSIFEGPDVPADILQIGAMLPMQEDRKSVV